MIRQGGISGHASSMYDQKLVLHCDWLIQQSLSSTSLTLPNLTDILIIYRIFAPFVYGHTITKYLWESSRPKMTLGSSLLGLESLHLVFLFSDSLYSSVFTS